MSKTTRTLDPRILQIAEPLRPHEKLMVLLMAHSTDEATLAGIVDMVNPGTVDYSTNVAGKQLHHWLGKSSKTLQRELGDGEDADSRMAEIKDAMEARGLTFVDDANLFIDRAAISERIAAERGEPSKLTGGPPDPDNTPAAPRPMQPVVMQTSPAAVPAAPAPRMITSLQDAEAAGGAGDAGGAADEDDTAFGENKLTLSQASAMSDEQLMAEPGIGEATIKRIRKLAKGK